MHYDYIFEYVLIKNFGPQYCDRSISEHFQVKGCVSNLQKHPYSKEIITKKKINSKDETEKTF